MKVWDQRKTKRKKGFTLVELVVAMVLMGIVSVISVSVTLMVSRSRERSRVDAKAETELIRLEKDFKACLMALDRKGHTILVDEAKNNCLSVEYSPQTGESPQIVKVMELDNGTLSYIAEAAYRNSELLLTYEKDSFEAVSAISFDVSGQIVRCKVTLDGTDYTHIMLYTMRAAEVKAEVKPAVPAE